MSDNPLSSHSQAPETPPDSLIESQIANEFPESLKFWKETALALTTLLRAKCSDDEWVKLNAMIDLPAGCWRTVRRGDLSGHAGPAGGRPSILRDKQGEC